MLQQRTVEQVQKSGVADVFVLTDSQEIENACRDWGLPVLQTSPNCQSGTERIVEADAKINIHYINVQGDEPFIDPSLIDDFVTTFVPSPPSLLTGIHKLDQVERISNPNQVKALLASDGRI